MTTFTQLDGDKNLALLVMLKFMVDNTEKLLGFGINITLRTTMFLSTLQLFLFHS
jgi:hypothetical protein